MKPAVLHLGSLRTTLVGCAFLGAVVFASPSWAWLGAAMGLLALNLVAALATHPALRRRFALLVAHLAMLLLLLLVGVGRIIAIDGRFELSEGVVFDGRLLDGSTPSRHQAALERLQLQQHGFAIEYAPGRKRGATRNRVGWVDAQGASQRAVIGDHHALQVDHYRITTSSNKGFAPLLRWTPDRGEPVIGSVHLPSFPVNELRQSSAWTLPHGVEAWVMLEIDGQLIDPARASSFEMPRQHRLVVRVADARHELAPGASIGLPGGRLHYEALRTWMGYRVTYDPTLPWLLAAALLAVAAMTAHYVQAFVVEGAPARKGARTAITTSTAAAAGPAAAGGLRPGAVDG